MTPEWMTDIPSTFGTTDWFVVPRPTGRRCLVIASRGRTVSYSEKDGNVMHKFFSLLPSGSKKTVQGTAGYTILDCVYNAQTHTYIVLDLMCWRGHQVYDCTAEFRITWLRSKLREEFGGALQVRGPNNKFRFEPAAFFNCDVVGFMQAYSRCKLPYDREGLVFVHKQGLYELGVNPLVMRWKDAATSKYFVDTTGSGARSKHQAVVLRADKDGTFRTMDNAVLGKFGAKFAQEKRLSPGALVRVLITGLKYDPTDDAPPKLHGVQFKGRGGMSRLYADTVSKILFQHMARNGSLTTVKDIGTALSNKSVAGAASQLPPALPPASSSEASHAMVMDTDSAALT